MAGSLVLFALVTGYVVSRISETLGSALDRAERELLKKNEDLGAMNEELGAMNEELVSIEEELRQNMDELGKNQEALRESEGRLSLAQQAAGAGIWDWEHHDRRDRPGRPICIEIFGIDPEKTLLRLTSGIGSSTLMTKKGLTCGFSRHWISTGPLTAITGFRGRVAEVRWINARGQGSYDDQGLPVRMSGDLHRYYRA